MYEASPIFWDEEDRGKSSLFCDTDFVYGKEPVYNTEDEGETFKQEVGVQNQISSPKFVITETNGYNVHKVFSGFYILYRHNLNLITTQEVI